MKWLRGVLVALVLTIGLIPGQASAATMCEWKVDDWVPGTGWVSVNPNGSGVYELELDGYEARFKLVSGWDGPYDRIRLDVSQSSSLDPYWDDEDPTWIVHATDTNWTGSFTSEDNYNVQGVSGADVLQYVEFFAEMTATTPSNRTAFGFCAKGLQNNSPTITYKIVNNIP